MSQVCRPVTYSEVTGGNILTAPAPLICARHGGKWDTYLNCCQTSSVLKEVAAERHQQFKQYGINDDLEDGTGPDATWLRPIARHPAKRIEALLRIQYETYEYENGKPTWVHLVLEEIAEAFQESDPERLREELVQVAALAVSWVEKIDARRGV